MEAKRFDTSTDLWRDSAAEEAEESVGLGHGFVSIVGYTNAHGEVADHVIQPADYFRLLARSLATLANVTAAEVAQGCPAAAGAEALAQQALDEVRASWQRTLDGESRAPEVYDSVAPGIDRHPENGDYYVCGVAASKTVRVPGAYKPVKSKPLTLVKRYVEGLAPVSGFRRFRLQGSGENWEAIRWLGQEVVSPRLAAVGGAA